MNDEVIVLLCGNSLNCRPKQITSAESSLPRISPGSALEPACGKICTCLIVERG